MVVSREKDRGGASEVELEGRWFDVRILEIDIPSLSAQTGKLGKEAGATSSSYHS